MLFLIPLAAGAAGAWAATTYTAESVAGASNPAPSFPYANVTTPQTSPLSYLPLAVGVAGAYFVYKKLKL